MKSLWPADQIQIASRLSFFRCIICIGIFLSTCSCFAAIEMTGSETVPPSPAMLNVNDYFSCGQNGSGLLKYPDGTSLNLSPSSEGQILFDGLKIKKGNIWVSYKKKGEKFFIRTPTAIIGIKGTEFGLYVHDNDLKVTLVNGVIEVIAGKKSMLLKPGQVLEIKNGTVDMRNSSPEDLKTWEKFLSSALPPTENKQKMPKFSDQYLYALILLNDGVAEVKSPDGTNKTISEMGSIIQTGASIETPGTSSVKLSLLGGSVIKLAPDSCMKIGKTSLTLASGACLVRHVSRGSPLKIEGKSTITIATESVVSVESSGDHFVIRVEVGSAFLPMQNHRISVGECIEATASEARASTGGPAPRAWGEPGHELSAKAHIAGVGALSPESESASATSATPSTKDTASGSDSIVDFQSALGF